MDWGSGVPRPEYNSSPDVGCNLSWCFCLDVLRHAIFTLSSGVADIDKKILDAVAKWKYKPRHSGCAVIENEMTATIHWGESHSTISTRMGSLLTFRVQGAH
jgi:hypothetical protein